MKAYHMLVRELEESDRIKKNLDKIGGYPTHLPPEGTCGDADFFLMQIYNDKGIWPYKEGVLCWQFYQGDDFGGYINKVIEVPVGAELNTGKAINKRRWLNEYVIDYAEEEEEVDESLPEDEYLEEYCYDPDITIFFTSKVGGYCNKIDREEYEKDGFEYVAYLTDALCDGEVNLGTTKKTIIRNKKTGVLEMW